MGLAGRRRLPPDSIPATHAASLVIPNWNGTDLLERFLPSWVAAIAGHPGSELIVVDNGSEDGSADWIQRIYPQVRLIALPSNLGFGGGSNAGFSAARNDVVVLLNSDMRVEPRFPRALTRRLPGRRSLRRLLPDLSWRPHKAARGNRPHSRLVGDGSLRVSHREDAAVDRLFPCFYGGGGSCAFDRRKFLALGGFDDLLAPVLSGRHGSRLSGVETRLESDVSAEQRGAS